MSEFSGKCDLCDTLNTYECIQDTETLKNKWKIYVGNKGSPLEIKRWEDLIPYYPCIISSGSFTKENGNVVHIMNESWVIYENRERMKAYAENYKRFISSCKRIHKKIGTPFDINKATEEWLSKEEWLGKDEALRNIIGQIKNGVKEKDLVYPLRSMAKYYVNRLIEYMKENGIDPKDYGYDEKELI